MKWLYRTIDDFDRIERHLRTIDNNNHAVIENLHKNIEINYIVDETVLKLKTQWKVIEYSLIQNSIK